MLPRLSLLLPVVRPDFANLYYPCFQFLLPHPSHFQRPFCHLTLSLPASRLLVSTPRMRSHSHCAADPAPAHSRSGPFRFSPHTPKPVAQSGHTLCLRVPVPLSSAATLPVSRWGSRTAFNPPSIDSFPSLPPVQDWIVPFSHSWGPGLPLPGCLHACLHWVVCISSWFLDLWSPACERQPCTWDFRVVDIWYN